jgi:hypothetical protein
VLRMIERLSSARLASRVCPTMQNPQASPREHQQAQQRTPGPLREIWVVQGFFPGSWVPVVSTCHCSFNQRIRLLVTAEGQNSGSGVFRKPAISIGAICGEFCPL